MARNVSTSKELVEAGLRVLREHGAAELTLRRVAEAAGASTMGIYTGFGGRTGLLEAIYLRGFESLRDALEPHAGSTAENTTGSTAGGSDGTPDGAPDGAPVERIRAVALAYRRFALADPELYALMFERPIPDFDPSPDLRRRALGMTFGLLTDATRDAVRARLISAADPVRAAYLVWTAIHGMVGIELTHSLRSPLPGWFLDGPEAGEKVLADGVDALLRGLR
ncbi:TetR/AcrR family transcriptional regulator [Planomonospora sp. ID82291]|uniref:TetR/AcrR family transcriptional regulator n=1 Tax=Planomonospora sp. ID82291 TaxID=2738136 RepID=UPI0018C3DDE9|nr:TetR/AcrR family transcriptional regulator [Planomonospora sp. ID82291]